MQSFRILVVCILTLSATSIVNANPASVPNPEFRRLQGTWEVVSMVNSGLSLSVPQGQNFIVKIEGSGLSTYKNGAQIGPTVGIYPNGIATPKQIDIFAPTKEIGIYKIEDDTLTVCYTTGSVRPSEFVSTTENKAVLFAFKRVVDSN